MHVAEGDRAGSHMCFVLEKKNHSTEAEEKKNKALDEKAISLWFLDRVLPRRSKVNRCLLWSI